MEIVRCLGESARAAWIGKPTAFHGAMASVLQRLHAAGLELPRPPVAGGNYLPHRIVGDLVFLPGAISSWNGDVRYRGKVGEALDVAAGYEAAKLCVLNLLANLQAAIGDLGRVRQVVSVNGYVNGVAGFPDAPKVVNGASDLLVLLYGDAGRHVRAAVTVAGLPQDAAVEVQMLVQVHPEPL
jgi:enamine deaminase RidA (YjgF/YER057c/UK114 family)